MDGETRDSYKVLLDCVYLKKETEKVKGNKKEIQNVYIWAFL